MPVLHTLYQPVVIVISGDMSEKTWESASWSKADAYVVKNHDYSVLNQVIGLIGSDFRAAAEPDGLPERLEP